MGNGRESGGWHHRHFDAGPPGLKIKWKSNTGASVFAVRSLRQIRFIWISDHLPHDDSPDPTATHTLQKSRRVCEPIA
jgi:hypothetical protein